MESAGDPLCVRSLAQSIRDAFLVYNEEFRAITRRARARFETRDWVAGQRDAAERIDLYDRHVDASVARLESQLGQRAFDRDLWRTAKTEFTRVTDDYPDVEFMRTYFSSVTRRIFGTRGVDAEIEYVGEETIPLRNIDGPLIGHNYLNGGSLASMFRQLLADCTWSVPFADPERCAQFLAARVTEHYRLRQEGDTVLCVDLLNEVFYRETRAYLIGKTIGWTRSTPLIVGFANTNDGIKVDSVVLDETAAGVVFGFTRSYFHADLHPVGSAIVFLRKVVPRETVHELFTVLGRAKQGKTERYRGLERHMRFSRDRFIVAPGKKGMVMAVFTLPSHDVVFKVIRDRFPPPKNTSRAEIKQRYTVAARHNKAGRLVDAQEYRMLRFSRDRFDPALLDELLNEAAESVFCEGNTVVVRHAWIERRLRPLDLYLREVDFEAGMRAVLDYGQALRDLASTNVFPGDLLTKNFGVTRAGRVIFYDYDEICLLHECNFRTKPRPRDFDDEWSAEPWYSVGPDDVFPEEFGAFLGFAPALMEVFAEAHGELLTAGYWQEVQRRIRTGEILEVTA